MPVLGKQDILECYHKFNLYSKAEVSCLQFTLKSLRTQMLEFGRRLGRGQFVVEGCLTRTGPEIHETEN